MTVARLGGDLSFFGRPTDGNRPLLIAKSGPEQEFCHLYAILSRVVPNDWGNAQYVMLHHQGTSKTGSATDQATTGTDDLSSLSTSRSDSLVSRNPLVPSTAYFLSRVLANPTQRAALLGRLDLTTDSGVTIDECIDSMLMLNLSNKRGPSPINPGLWIPKLEPSELPFEAARRHMSRQQPAEGLAIEKLAMHMGEMAPECALTICIPVSTEEPVDTVTRTLQLLAQQTCDKARFDVLLLLNHPEEDTGGDERGSAGFYEQCEPLLATVDVAREAGLRVYACAAAAPEDVLSIGHIRGVLHAIAVERYRQRGPGYADHLLMRADIDMEFIEPTLVETLLRESERSRCTVNFFGRLRPAPGALVEDPLLLFGYQLYDRLADLRVENGKNPCGGPNATTWLTAYVQAGGYEPWFRCGEDVSHDTLLCDLANEESGYTPYVYLDDCSTIYTDTRRAEVASLAGFAPAQQWHPDVAVFSARNPEIRATRKVSHGTFDEVLRDPLLRSQIEEWTNQSAAIFFTQEGVRDQRVMARLADIISSDWGMKISVTVNPSPNITGALEYRLVVEDLGRFSADVLRRRADLLATLERMKGIQPFATTQERPRAPGLKYDR